MHLFSGHVADGSFPSDHATAAFAIAVAILLRKRGWGIFALVAAAVLSVGRVAIGVHYPSDVLGGAALGTAAALSSGSPRSAPGSMPWRTYWAGTGIALSTGAPSVSASPGAHSSPLLR